VSLVGVEMRPTHDSGRKPINGEIEAWLGRIPFQDGSLNAERITFEYLPVDVVKGHANKGALKLLID
jgi:hypothetical protein